MDIVTQGLLGGVLAQTVARDPEKKPATLAGVAAGLLADADVLIRSTSDPLLVIEYHRHFTHSLFFVPFGAAIATLLLWPLLRRSVTASRLYVFCLAGYSLSGVLDACTSYGTLLFWPFSDQRIALNLISIIDPVFSLALLIALLTGLVLKQRVYAVCGLLFCAVYLSFGKLQQERARLLAEYLVEKRGHIAAHHVIKPTLGNLLLWRSVYRDDKRIYVDAIRMSVFRDALIYSGESVPLFTMDKDMYFLERGSVLHRDIQRFIRFSDGFVALDRDTLTILGDIRYSMLPISSKPLWGITINGETEQHVDYQFFRQTDAVTRQAFLDMLMGRTVFLGDRQNSYQLPEMGI